MEKNKNKFSSEQLLAMSTESHLSVSANAGSGKTLVLVNRFVNLLKEGVKPQEIVAITFTKKAGKEIYERISKKIESELQSNQCTEYEKGLLLTAKKTLYKSNIGTIHKFCKNLIDKYGFEAGLPKTNIIIEEHEFLKIQKTIFSKTLKEFINTPSFSYSGSFSEVLRLYDLNELRSIVSVLLNKIDRLEDIKNLNILDSNLLSEQLLKRFKDVLLSQINSLSTLVPDFIFSVENELTLVKTFSSKKNAFYSILPFFQSNDVDISVRNFKETLTEFLKACSSIIHGRNFSKQSLSVKLLEQKELISKTIKFTEEFSSFETSYIVEYSRLQIQIVQFALTVLNNIQEYLRSESLYTQDGILLYALEIVSIQNLQNDITEQFKYYMIDEFQDTNQLQLNIFSKLIPSLFSEVRTSNGNLYIVGDVKQSIYGFRSADVRVFAKAKDYISTSNLHANIPNNGIVQLSATFRLLPYICTIVNEFGSMFINSEISEYDVEYSPLVCGRKWRYPESSSITFLLAEENKNNTNQLSEVTTFPEILSTESDDNTDLEDDLDYSENSIPLSTVHLISKYIHSIINILEIEEINPITGEIEKRTCTYKDIAIISAERSKYSEFKKEFIQKSIPCTFDLENDFFERPEIEDLFSFLEFLNDPENDLALSSVLRSPYFSFSTFDLIELSRIKTSYSLWEKLKEAPNTDKNITEKQRNIFRRANNLLLDLLPMAARLKVSLLIKTILLKTEYHLYIQKQVNAEDIYRNIESLLTIVRKRQNEGFRSIYDFIEDIRERMVSKSKITSSSTSKSKNELTILSIHGAKGLEFPIVIFLDNEKKSTRKHSSILDSSGLINVPLYVRKNNKKAKIQNPFTTLTNIQEKEKEFAEKKRKIYVALTRAKDHLIIAGSYTVSKASKISFSKNSALEMITKSLEIDPEYVYNLPDNKTSVTKIFQLETFKSVDEESVNTIEIINVPISLIKSIVEDFDTEFSEEIDTLETSINTETQTPLFYPALGRNQIIHTASQLISFIKDPKEYFYSTKLGLNNSKNFVDEIEYDTELALSYGKEFGSAVHTFIPFKLLCYNEKGNLIEEKFKKLLTIIEGKYSISSTLLNEVSKCTILAWDYLDQQVLPRDSILFETPFMLHFDNDIIRGVFDCLIINDSKVTIIDWKTNNLLNNSVNDLEKVYSTQMDLYALVSFKMQGITNVETNLVFINTGTNQVQVIKNTLTLDQVPELENRFRTTFEQINILFEKGINSL